MRITDHFSPILTTATCCEPKDPACCDDESCCGEGSDNDMCC